MLKLGRQRREVAAGDGAEVLPGKTHALWNASEEPVEILAEIIFPPTGLVPQADLLKLLELDAGLSRDGKLNPRTRQPRLLQMAVTADYFREAIALPGPLWLQRALLRPLAILGGRRGYRSTYPEYES